MEINIKKIEKDKSEFVSFEVKRPIEKAKNRINRKLKDEYDDAFIVDIDLEKFQKK